VSALVTATWSSLLNGLASVALVRRGLNALVRGQGYRHLTQLDQRHAPQVQAQVLLSFIRHAIATPFGHRHDFRRIRTVADFRRLVPIRTPAELAGETEPAAALSLAGLAERQMLRTALSLAARFSPPARLLAGLTLVLDPETGPSGRAVDLIANLPPLIRPFARTHIGPDRHGNDDPIGGLAEQYARDEVSCLVGPPTSLVALIERVKRIRAQDRLERVWPHLCAVVCLQPGTRPVPVRLLDELTRESWSKPYIVQILLRPEGPLAIRDGRQPNWRLLTDHGVFFEFLPTDGRPTRLGLDEIEAGVPYDIAVSAPTGVWACRTGVRFVFDSRAPALLRDITVTPAVSAPPAHSLSRAPIDIRACQHRI
jgi:GH3 auxin-responsive promoter